MYLSKKVTRLRPKVFSPKILKESALGDFIEVRYFLFIKVFDSVGPVFQVLC